ncbi:DUF4136 domain-containing protein [Sinomicrobium soli]|uniref:DUF4136 domain-containing protein n=1 Tax=Sinomicrobium sp. N-1-3-6 TaxID=2219864 RepID=UPI000DCEE425|nr:DUF4136 domain-containing protein [Sinomicrobium sp. N-1-3-6]RAV30584.1 DUF4136 domain-containing protein [Sinomicrobium sp. N-1-3-6]
MRFSCILVVLLLLGSCASVKTDYDPSVSFSSYRTFGFYPEMRSGLNQLDEKRVTAAVEALLKTRGMTLSDTPDMYINIFTRNYERPYNSSVGIGVGTGGRRGGIGISGGIPIPIRSNAASQEVTFDLIDAGRDELFWQGVYEVKVRNNASPEAKEAMYHKVVQKVFSRYPPRKK